MVRTSSWHIRRTTTLGALMTFGVMLNVLMLNFCYDVPVKLLSFHIVFFSLILLLPVWRDVYQFFFTRNSFERTPYPFYNYKQSSGVMVGLKIGIFILAGIAFIWYAYSLEGSRNEKSIIQGKYDVSLFTKFENGSRRDTLYDDEIWTSINKGYPGYIGIKHKNSDEDLSWYVIKESEGESSFLLKRRGESDFQVLRYSEISDDSLSVYGAWYGDSISFTLSSSKQSFLLKNREFNWVQEYPFNR